MGDTDGAVGSDGDLDFEVELDQVVRALESSTLVPEGPVDGAIICLRADASHCVTVIVRLFCPGHAFCLLTIL